MNTAVRTAKEIDPLAYLPNRAPVEYTKRATAELPAGFYLVVKGRIALHAGEVVDEIYGPDELFHSQGSGVHSGVALDDAALIMWPDAEVEDLIDRQPRLGIALLRLYGRRENDRVERLRSMAQQKTPGRVGVALLHFAGTGERLEDGSVVMPPITHQKLAEYIGTSREIVTFQLNHLRSKGLVRYSRREMRVWPAALREHLEAAA
jgi:CRP/FNR family transcriptional regulator